MTTDPEWLQAARLLRLDCAEPPEALELEQIARLQRPAPKAWRERADLAKALRRDIEAGELKAEARAPADAPAPSSVGRTPRRPNFATSWADGIGSPSWRAEFAPKGAPFSTAKVAPPSTVKPEPVFIIKRADLAAWPGLPEAKRSEGIRAWLRPLEQAEEAAPAKRKSETQVDRVARCLTDCETRAAAHGEPFDRENMPGTKAEFLDLLHALDAELWSIKTVDSLDRYLSKTGCKWPLNAGKQSSAAPLYARLFPEARIRAPGAVSPQRRKA